MVLLVLAVIIVLEVVPCSRGIHRGFSQQA